MSAWSEQRRRLPSSREKPAPRPAGRCLHNPVDLRQHEPRASRTPRVDEQLPLLSLREGITARFPPDEHLRRTGKTSWSRRFRKTGHRTARSFRGRAAVHIDFGGAAASPLLSEEKGPGVLHSLLRTQRAYSSSAWRDARVHPTRRRLELYVRREVAERFIEECEATRRSWRRSCGSRCRSSKVAGRTRPVRRVPVRRALRSRRRCGRSAHRGSG